MHTDKELIELAKKGNQKAFRLLVERYQQQVRTTVVGMLGDVAETDDVHRMCLSDFISQWIDLEERLDWGRI